MTPNPTNSQQCEVTCDQFPMMPCQEAHRCVKYAGHPFDPMYGDIHEFETHQTTVKPRRAAVAGPGGDVLAQVRELLDRYTQPCTEDCKHSQCPLLRELNAIAIKATLERAQQTVKPIVDREREGEIVGDLMNIRLRSSDVIAIVSATRQSSLWNCNGYDQALTDTLEELCAAASAPTPAESDRILLEALRRVRADQDDFWTFYQADPLMVKAADRIEELLAWHGTEQSMHAAWRKRAEEAEAQLAAPPESTRVAGERAWKCACGWSGMPSEMTISNDLRTCPNCGGSGGLILDAAPSTSDNARRAAEEEFLAASVAVWQEIDRLSQSPEGYKGLDASTELRKRERAAWENYKPFAAAPADNDAESSRRAELPSPAQQALQIVTAWRAVVGGDDLLIHYIKQAIEENRATTTKGDR